MKVSFWRQVLNVLKFKIETLPKLCTFSSAEGGAAGAAASNAANTAAAKDRKVSNAEEGLGPARSERRKNNAGISGASGSSFTSASGRRSLEEAAAAEEARQSFIEVQDENEVAEK